MEGKELEKELKALATVDAKERRDRAWAALEEHATFELPPERSLAEIEAQPAHVLFVKITEYDGADFWLLPSDSLPSQVQALIDAGEFRRATAHPDSAADAIRMMTLAALGDMKGDLGAFRAQWAGELSMWPDATAPTDAELEPILGVFERLQVSLFDPAQLDVRIDSIVHWWG